MLRVGVVGVGFMGMIHYLAYQKVRGAKVTAICSRDRKKLAGDWRGIQGNFGPPGTMMDLSGIKTYEDWQEMLHDPEIDLIDICLPPALHGDVAIAAAKAGKHALVEKPIALEHSTGQRMLKAAERAGTQLLIAHVLPFVPEYAFARQMVQSGKYGRLLGGHFKRIISDPSWLKDFFDPQAVGGPVVDLHIHDAHFIRMLCGMPQAVYSTGRMRGDVVEFFTTQFLFADHEVQPDQAAKPPHPRPLSHKGRRELALTATGGVVSQQGRSFTHAFEIYLEKATLMYDSAVIDGQPVTNMPLTVLGPKGKVTRPKLNAADAFVAELSEVVRAVRSGQGSPILGGNLALDALVLCEKQTQSVRSEKLVSV
ncbi:MAG TPA: Gfo/Idh/MocA family oxidoreductase [Planctomycetaceae bacterium]|nr:Gfo/Idh/MocA family oxidoreductase [Planctomycetaceae bacterium]